MEYINNQLCISATELTGVMTKGNYNKLAQRGHLEKLQRGGGPGRCALVVVDSLPDKYRTKVKELYPEGGLMVLHDIFRRNYEPDVEARRFFTEFRLDNGQPLPPKAIMEYTTNASVIRTVIRLKNHTQGLRRAKRGTPLAWEDLAEAVKFFKAEYGHTLPASTLRFRKAVGAFNRGGYESLVSGRFQNQNSRKVDHRVDRLVLSIDAQPERPFNTTVADNYNSFVCGELDVWDPETGEMYDPDEFVDKNGEPLVLSDSTIANILNNPLNKALRAKFHSTDYDFNNEYRPHHHRKPPFYAFSKISLDDRDLPRKMHDGKRLKAYYAYDVASGCVVGYAYSRDKTADLFLDCVRNMFQLIDRQSWSVPAQVEVERHLVSEFKDGLMQAGRIFPFVRWCNPTNSQEKRAEHFNKAKKYGVEKLTQTGIGRWYAKLEVNRTKTHKVFDAENNTYKEPTYDRKQLQQEDIASIHAFNHSKHPNQKKYPGLTRWDVLVLHQNPDLAPMDKAVLYRFIGEKVVTTIKRNMYCQVNYANWQLPHPEVVKNLEPRNMSVDAYFLPDNDGNTSEVYLYQGDRFIAECKPVNAYNEATIEQTEDDVAAYREQSGYVASFDALIERNKIAPVAMSERQAFPIEEPETVGYEEPADSLRPDDTFDCDYNYGARGLEDL
jgi:hypothetical protein